MASLFRRSLCGLLIFLLASAAAAEGPLVGVSWLREQLGRADLRVLDASGTAQFNKQRIPGAVNADPMRGGPLEGPPERVQARLRALGIREGETLVLVDPGGTWMAAKLFWDLQHAGLPVERLHLLDGGMAAWRAAGAPLSSEAVTPPPAGDQRVLALDEAVRVRLPEFLAATAAPQQHVLLEALDPSYYYGGAAFFNRAGHVPHATLMPAEDFFGADKRFKTAAEIRRMLAHQGVRAEQQVLSYCGGGGAAAVPYFALRFIAGHERVRLFQESQLGWLQDPRELPLWSYAEPSLLRDAAWVKSFAGPMLKALGLAKTTLIDLRSAEQHAQGHLPLALNIPLQDFKRLDDKALAARLGQAGLDREHEAVLIAEGGLSPEIALAFARLERLGQRRVSLLLDSTEAWAERGNNLGKAQQTIAPRNYLLAPPRTAAALYPATVLGSGRQASAGAAIQLPYAELLDAAGRPRAAPEIWKRLAAAGVPRYAELVLRAEDPAEAAVNYVLLRLMGFAALRVEGL